jgi:bifunctional UDP-N-acetylglucosamine pyrophosphorylase/glucosamine-1-phosphate N-acetyltransferase
MKRNLTVILLLPGQGFKGKKHLPPFLRPILGQSPLSLIAEKMERLKPERKLIAGEKIEEKVGELPGWEWLSGKGETKAEPQANWLSQLAPEEEPLDFLIINACFPLLEEKSLRQLLEKHRLKQAALTCFHASFQISDISRERKKEKNFSDVVAFVLQKEALRFLAKDSSNFLVSDYKDFSSLKLGLEKAGQKVLDFPLSETESLDIRDDEARFKIISLLRRRKVQELTQKGVSFLAPESVWIDLKVKIGSGSVISPAVVIEGSSSLGREVKVQPFVHIIDSQIGPRSTILSACRIEGSQLGPDVRIGPFTHLRPGTIIKAGAHVGNFVEMKKTVFGRRSKAMHLSYLGDSLIGDEVNIGAGTITCNYDGRQKHQTIIEKGAFIGSGTELVAPVKIGRGAYVGAGSTITKNVSPDALAIARARQVEIPDWAKRRRQK